MFFRQIILLKYTDKIFISFKIPSTNKFEKIKLQPRILIIKSDSHLGKYHVSVQNKKICIKYLSLSTFFSVTIYNFNSANCILNSSDHFAAKLN